MLEQKYNILNVLIMCLNTTSWKLEIHEIAISNKC